MASKQYVQIVGIQKPACLLILLFLALKHLVVDVARFYQAGIEAMALIAVWIQAKLICSHRSYHTFIRTDWQAQILLCGAQDQSAFESLRRTPYSPAA